MTNHDLIEQLIRMKVALRDVRITITHPEAILLMEDFYSEIDYAIKEARDEQ